MGCAGFRKTVVTTDVNGITTTNTVFDASKLAPIAKRLAKEGTRLPLIEHPEWRKEYVKAVVDLKALEARDTIDLSLLTEIVNRIPASELNSQEARLAIEGGETVLEIVDGVLEANGKTIPLDRVNDVRAVVTALRQGVEEGLAAAPTQ